MDIVWWLEMMWKVKDMSQAEYTIVWDDVSVVLKLISEIFVIFLFSLIARESRHVHAIFIVFLVGSRNYLQLQQFTHFMITAEAFNAQTNRTTIAGPKRVGRFQLFGDSLTKFYEDCVNTVSEADDFPKTEVQVSSNFSHICSINSWNHDWRKRKWKSIFRKRGRNRKTFPFKFSHANWKKFSLLLNCSHLICSMFIVYRIFDISIHSKKRRNILTFTLLLRVLICLSLQ